MDIKKTIREQMDAKGMTIYSLAQASDLTQTCISNWFGKRNYEPSVSALEKVCKALDMRMSQLFLDDDENIIPVTSDEKQLLQNFDKLSEKQKQAILLLIESFNK